MIINIILIFLTVVTGIMNLMAMFTNKTVWNRMFEEMINQRMSIILSNTVKVVHLAIFFVTVLVIFYKVMKKEMEKKESEESA